MEHSLAAPPTVPCAPDAVECSTCRLHPAWASSAVRDTGLPDQLRRGKLSAWADPYQEILLRLPCSICRVMPGGSHLPQKAQCNWGRFLLLGATPLVRIVAVELFRSCHGGCRTQPTE